MKLQILTSLIITAALTGCGPGSGDSSLRYVDYEPQIDLGEMDDISSKVRVVRVIRPELTDTTMLVYPHISAIDDKYIYIGERGDVSACFKFDIASGKAVDRLYRRGPGPDEYQAIATMAYDKSTGGWDVHDYFPNKRMITYDRDHNMTASHKVDSLFWIRPSAHGGWWAVNDMLSTEKNDGMKRIVYHYDKDWNSLGSREFPSRRSDVRITGQGFNDGVFTMGGRDYVFVNDTVMVYEPDTDNFVPSIAFNLGRFTWEGNYDQKGYREALGTGKIAHPDITFNDHYLFMCHAIMDKMNTFDIYDLDNGKLVYRHNIPGEYNFSEGFPVEVDGVTMYGWPREFVNDGHFFLIISENAISEATGSDESNPIIVEIELQ